MTWFIICTSSQWYCQNDDQDIFMEGAQGSKLCKPSSHDKKTEVIINLTLTRILPPPPPVCPTIQQTKTPKRPGCIWWSPILQAQVLKLCIYCLFPELRLKKGLINSQRWTKPGIVDHVLQIDRQKDPKNISSLLDHELQHYDQWVSCLFL